MSHLPAVTDDNFEVEGVRVCLTAARPVYRLFDAESALQAVHPDAEHSFPPDARKAAYEFLGRVGLSVDPR